MLLFCRCLFVVLYCCCLPFLSYGQEANKVLRFVPITHINELRTTSSFLIGAEQTEGSSPYFAFLQPALRKDRKAVAMPYGTATPQHIAISAEQAEKISWEVIVENDSTLWLRHQGLYLSKDVSKSSTQLQLHTSKGAPWTFSFSDGKLVCRHQNRFLGLSANAQANGSYLYYYGAYTKGYAEVHLTLYRLAKDLNDWEGDASLPPFELPIALTTHGSVALTDGKFVEKEDFLLCDSTLAPSDLLLRCIATPQSAKTFALRPLAAESMPQEIADIPTWQILHGHIATTEATPRFLLGHNGKLSLLTAAAALAEHIEPIGFTRLAAPPQKRQQHHSFSLHGGWTAKDLLHLPFTEALELDFTNATLPAKLPPLPATWNKNTLVRLLAQQRWAAQHFPFVVCEDTLQRAFTLTDREPYTFSQPFFASEGQLTYRRSIYNDKGWETLSLPFSAILPKSIAGERLEERKGNTLTFTPTDTIGAGEALIFKSQLSQTGEPTPITLYNRSGWVRMPQSLQGFIGTHELVTPTSEEQIYFLNEEGSLFLRAAAGSQLSSFRAYFTHEAAPLFRLEHRLTGIFSLLSPTPPIPPPPLYDLSGRRIVRPSRGIVLQLNKKFIYKQ